ncbi:MAG: S8 family serine peptidase [Acidobacteriota bacterium]
MIFFRCRTFRLGLLIAAAAILVCSSGESIFLSEKAILQDAIEVVGFVTSIPNATDFFVDDSHLIRTDQGTLFSGPPGFRTFGDLQIGDFVSVTGWVEGDAIRATMVILLNPGGEPAIIDDSVSWVVDSSTFVIGGSVEVSIHQDTILEGMSSLLELSPGDLVHIEGWWFEGNLVADLVRLVNDPQPPIYIEGFVTEVVSATDFILDDSIFVMTSPRTLLSGFQSIDELQPGDNVAVVGTISPGGIIADSVELLSTPGTPVGITGTVDSVIDNLSFGLTDGSIVVTDAETVFYGIDGVSDLQEGDLILAEGWWVQGVFHAMWVDRTQTTPDLIEVTGLLAYLEPPDAFVLDDQTRVAVTGETLWIGLNGFDDLGSGDTLRIVGFFGPGSWFLTAVEIERTAQSEPTWITREGWVEHVIDPSTILLTDGITLEIRPDAELISLDSVEHLGPGDRIGIGAFTTADPDILDVTRLELLERPGNPVDFVSVVESIDLPSNRFSTTDGFEVIVDGATLWVNVDGLADLDVGDGVSVTGIAGRDPRHPQWVDAVLVEWREGEDDGDGDGDGDGGGLRMTIEGAVSEILPDGVVEVDFDLHIGTSAETDWRGTLNGLQDLVVGTPVRTEVILETDGTMDAIWIEGFPSTGSGIRDIEGYVLEVDVVGNQLRLETGEWIRWDEFTRIDGDVGTFPEIQPGMHVDVIAVDLGDGTFLSFSVFVELEITDVGALGYPDEPTRETLVVLRDGAIAFDVATRHGAVVTGTIPGLLVHLFQWDHDIDLLVLQALLDDEDVEILEPNRSFSDPESDPDSIRRRAIAIDRQASSDDFNTQDGLYKAGLDVAHARSLGRGTMVAVIDTGIDPFHPLLRHRIAEGGYDFVDEDTLPWETADGIDQDNDDEIDEGAGHGTFVSGLVLLAAPASSILPFRVLDDDGRGSTFDISRAVLLAIDRGADIINMSFAYPDRSRVLDRILMEASCRGVVLVSGAGNSGLSTLPFPANDNRVLAVAAVDGDLRLADFSNRGVDVTLGAPGVDVYSAGLGAQFGIWSGTSMAAPLVSGTAALMRSINPYLTPEQISAALTQGAAAANPDDDLQFLLHAGNTVNLIPDGPQ